MNELTALATNIPFLPEWAKIVAFNLFGLYVILQLVYLILQKLQKTEIRDAISGLRDFSGEALHRAARALELPVERPRLAIVSFVLNSFLLYIFALIFFAFFGFLFVLSASSEGLPFINRLMGFGVAACFFIACRWYFVLAERERIVVVEHWKILRQGRSDS